MIAVCNCGMDGERNHSIGSPMDVYGDGRQVRICTQPLVYTV